MIRNSFLRLALLILFFFVVTAQYAIGQMVYPGDVDLLGAEETVFDWTTDACEQENIPDAPARAFRDAAGNIVLNIAHYRNYRMIGSDFDNLITDCSPTMISDYDSLPQNFNNYEWIVSTYTEDGETIMGIVHNEHHGYEYVGQCNDQTSSAGLNCWYNTMTYAISTDSGKTYVQSNTPDHYLMGTPYRQDSTGSGPHGIFGGSNIIKSPLDGYYYQMIHTEALGLQVAGTSIARTSDPFDPASWRGWDGEDFTVVFENPYTHPGINPADHVVAQIGQGFIEKMNSHISWNTYFNKFVLVGSAQKSNVWGIYYALSDDLVHWSARKRIMEGNMLINPNKSTTADVLAYPSLIDHTDTSRNFEVTGQEAHLYFTRWKQVNGLYDRDLVRIPIRFNKLEVSGWTINGAGQQYDAHPGDGICATASGKCNLNAAFQESNNRLPGDSTFVARIDFNTTALNIKAQDQLFSLMYPVELDASDLAAYSANTSDIGSAMDLQPGLTINLNENGGINFMAKNSGIKGIALRNMSGPAVSFFADSGFVEACILGSYAEGLTDEISATDGRGVVINDASYVTIGGETADKRNMILGGIEISGPHANHNEIQGNYIGTDRTGDGVFYVNTGGISISNEASHNMIGGSSLNSGNVISGHTAPGISIGHSSHTDIINNLIGTDATGTKDRGNQRSGIFFGDNATHVNIIGNVISNNSSDEAGIWAVADISDISIEGNFIGTDRSGTLDLANGDSVNFGGGITFGNGAHNIQVGGEQAGEGNVIAYNRGDGILFFGSAGSGISILGNSIYENGKLGIQLPEVYLGNPIDHLDQDGGANGSQNMPEITSASLVGTSLSVSGTFHSEANKTYRLEFFINASCDDYSQSQGGFGEGEELLGSTSVSTDASGNASFSLSYTVSNAQGKVITSTATSPEHSTSEFSACVEVLAPAAEMALSTHAFLETLSLGGTGSDTLTIYSTGTDSLIWSMTNQEAWLSTQPISGTIASGDSVWVIIQYDASNLQAGTHADTIDLVSDDPTQQLLNLPIEINVVAQPDIYIAFDTLKVTIPEGGHLTKHFNIENQGSDPLTWQMATQAGISWLHQISPNSGTISGNSFEETGLKFEDASLTAGVYYGAAWITSDDPNESHTEFMIKLTVEADSSGGNGGNSELLFSIGPQGFCPGEEVEVYFQLKGETFNPGNELKVFASASNGDFSAPLLIKSVLDSDTVGAFYIKIPESASPGNLYKLRLTSSSPVLQSADIEGLSIHAQPDVQLAPFPDVCLNLAPFALDQGQPVGGTYSGSGIIGEMFDPSHVQAGIYHIKYVFTNDKECTAEKEGTLTVLEAPEVAFPAFTSIICDNFLPLPLTSASPDGGVYSGAGVENGKFNPALVGEGDHMIRYTYSAGGCTDSAESAISVRTSPDVYLAPIDPQCEGAIAVELLTSPSGGILEGPGIFNATFNPGLVNVGTHTIGYEIFDGFCSGIATIEVDVIENPQTPVITLVGDFLRLDQSYEKIEWYVNGNLIAGENGILIKPRRTGIFTAQVFGEGACSSTSEGFLYEWPTSIDEELLHAWRMYPNPASQQVSLSWDPSLFSFSSELTFRVYDGLGKLVHEQKAGRNQLTLILQIDRWPAGIYMVEMLSGNRRAQRRLVVEGKK